MSDNTKIEWADATWNPVVGCTRVSEGCMHCYAERFAARFPERFGGVSRMTEHGPRWTGKIVLRPEVLDQPLSWRKPRRIFVNSMSDLFHPDVPDEFIDRVFAVMALATHHTFMVLTKRPERMMKYLTAPDRDEVIGWKAHELYEQLGGDYRRVPALTTREGTISTASLQPHAKSWPIPNVWLGVSVENQRAADERIPLLLQTPAAVRFLSCEPLLGSVDLSKFKPFDGECFCQDRPDGCKPRNSAGCPEAAIDWVIVGGESGPKARPMHPDWVRSIRDQCQAAGVPFFFKQWGEWELVWMTGEYQWMRVGKKAAGRLLDGRTWDEIPVMNQ